jgi:hypothetical protein
VVKQLAGVVASIGLILAALIALSPVTVEVPPGGDGRCGPPLVRVAAQQSVDDPNEQAVIDRCEDKAGGRLVLSAVPVGVGVLGFLGLRIAAGRREVLAARRKRADRQRVEWDRREAEAHRARVEESARRDEALRG